MNKSNKSNKSKKSNAGKSMTKTQMISEIANQSDLTKSQVTGIMDIIISIVESELKGGRPALIPGLVKISVLNKPAVPARPGKMPGTGEPTTFKAKPARKMIKSRPVGSLKNIFA